MAEVAVINASPLIFLARGGHLDLLSHFYSTVLVPRQVANEICARGSGDLTAKALQSFDWLQVTDAPEIPSFVEAWGIGAGESAVLALASATEDADVIVDDLAGRKCGLSLGLPVRGTLGLILLAKKNGLIPAARPVLEDLICGGMYLSRRVLDKALARVGE